MQNIQEQETEICYGSSTEPEADQGFAESKTFIQAGVESQKNQ